MSPTPKRILLYRLGSLGDHLITVPAYGLVRRVFPGVETRLLTNIPVAAKAAAAEAVLAGSGLVDGFLTYEIGERNPLALLKLIWRIRKYGADTLVYLAAVRGVKAAKRDQWFFRACGIRHMIGLPLTEELQRNLPLPPRGDGVPWVEHEADRIARCLTELGDTHAEDPANWSLRLTEAERARAAELLEPLGGEAFFTVSVGTKAPSKDWGVEKWAAFFAAFTTEHPGRSLVLLGAADEKELSEPVAEAWRSSGNRAFNLCGACSPRVSAAVMERAEMYFGHDSGPTHLAASVGIPVLGIYNAQALAGRWFAHGEKTRVLMHWVECGGCRLSVCVVQAKKCIASITVEEALEAAREQHRKWVLAG